MSEAAKSWKLIREDYRNPVVMDRFRRNGKVVLEIGYRLSRTGDNGDQDIQTDYVDAALQDHAGQRRPDDKQAVQAATGGQAAHRRTPQCRRHDDPPPGRRPQAEAAAYRLQARKVWRAGTRGDD